MFHPHNFPGASGVVAHPGAYNISRQAAHPHNAPRQFRLEAIPPESFYRSSNQAGPPNQGQRDPGQHAQTPHQQSRQAAQSGSSAHPTSAVHECNQAQPINAAHQQPFPPSAQSAASSGRKNLPGQLHLKPTNPSCGNAPSHDDGVGQCLDQKVAPKPQNNCPKSTVKVVLLPDQRVGFRFGFNDSLISIIKRYTGMLLVKWPTAFYVKTLSSASSRCDTTGSQAANTMEWQRFGMCPLTGIRLNSFNLRICLEIGNRKPNAMQAI